MINDYVIVERDLTCSDVHQIARFSTNETVCEILDDVFDACCSKMDGFTLESDSIGSSSRRNQLLSWMSVFSIALSLVLR